jgi:hypothetical protein
MVLRALNERERSGVASAVLSLLVAALAAQGCGTDLPTVPPLPPASPSVPPTAPPTQPLPIEGPYYLTTIIDPSCADRFPRSVRRREFAINVRPAEERSYFDFVTPDTFAIWIRGSFIFPSGYVAGSGDIHVILEFYQNFSQNGTRSNLTIYWDGDKTFAYSAPDRAIGGLIGGCVRYAEDDDPEVRCESAYHQIALTPR